LTGWQKTKLVIFCRKWLYFQYLIQTRGTFTQSINIPKHFVAFLNIFKHFTHFLTFLNINIFFAFLKNFRVNMFKNVKKCLKQFWLIAKFEVQTVVRLFFLKTCVFFSKIQNSKNNGDYIILFSLTLNHLFQQQFSIII
jgi:hypothetical protein